MRKYWKWYTADYDRCVIAFLRSTANGETGSYAGIRYVDGHEATDEYRFMFSPEFGPSTWIPCSRCEMRKFFRERNIDYDRSL